MADCINNLLDISFSAISAFEDKLRLPVCESNVFCITRRGGDAAFLTTVIRITVSEFTSTREKPYTPYSAKTRYTRTLKY